MLTFREFLTICEKKSSTPPHAVPGTYQEKDGVKTYTLARHDAPPTPLGTEKKVKKELEKQGGIGGGAIKKAKKKAKKISKIEEQTPHMQPNLYSKQVAMRQGAQKTAQIKHVHQELGAEARAQQSAKNARMKAILSR
jgi:hypothetical protein